MELILVRTAPLEKLYESFHRKRVVLRRHIELQLTRFLAGITFLYQFRLIEDLPRISEELFAFGGELDAFVRPYEDRDAELVLEFMDGGGKARLGYIESLGSAGDVAFFCYGYYILKLLECHGITLLNIDFELIISLAIDCIYGKQAVICILPI